MKYAIILLAALALSACDNQGQEALDDATMICKDNVEYMSFYKMSSNGSVSLSIVPHFKSDGSLYTCKREIKK